MVKFLEEEGAYQFTVDTVNKLSQTALEFLDKAIPDKNEAGDALMELTNTLLHRQS
jgi:geranylgeranyl pyrophosphate synthase